MPDIRDLARHAEPAADSASMQASRSGGTAQARQPVLIDVRVLPAALTDPVLSQLRPCWRFTLER
jgi:hypothetical protein